MAFRPTLTGSLVLGLLMLGFAALGQWQLQRAWDKAGQVERFETADRVSRLPESGPLRFVRVTLEGRFDPTRHVLVDNRIHRGRAGVHVLTPFRPARGAPLLLVNRGWLPLAADRRSLPEVPEQPGPLTISGHLDHLQRPGATPGGMDVLEAGMWPQLVTYPDIEAISSALDEAVYPWVLYLDANSEGGFQGRDWEATSMSPARHRAYAVQWFALAATAAAAWLTLGWLRGRERLE